MNRTTTYHFGGFAIRFGGDSSILEDVRLILHGWPYEDVTSDTSVIDIQTKSVEKIPGLPNRIPDVIDIIENIDGSNTIVSLYRYNSEVITNFGGIASSRIQLNSSPLHKINKIDVWITDDFLRVGKYEDLLFTSLAPIFRRNDCYFMHAFAVTINGKALLLVGPSGCGKTTSGLVLINSGWDYLANDVALIRRTERSLMAEPSPGGIGISRKTVDFVPSLEDIWLDSSSQGSTVRIYIPAKKVTGGWATPAPIAAICFPEITHRQQSNMAPLNKATALAKLMENSIDRWDTDYLPQHLSVLELLCQQASTFTLKLGSDLGQLSELLLATW